MNLLKTRYSLSWETDFRNIFLFVTMMKTQNFKFFSQKKLFQIHALSKLLIQDGKQSVLRTLKYFPSARYYIIFLY